MLLPKHRGDLVHTAVAVERMRAGAIEALRVPTNPLDVLAQQVVAATAVDEWDVDELFTVVRRSAPFATLPRSAYDATLDLLSGRYPSDEFRELRPRVVWDRVAGTLTAPTGRAAAGRHQRRHHPRPRAVRRLPRRREGVAGSASSTRRWSTSPGSATCSRSARRRWRIEDITHDRVLVSPAPGQPGRLPFWKGDQLGRPAELGAAIGAFTRELVRARPASRRRQRCTDAGLDDVGRGQPGRVPRRAARGHQRRCPRDRTVLVERFRDELGDWRIVIHSPYGAQVHAPWALAIGVRLRERYGIDAQALPGDDGIVLRVPETDQDPPGADVVVFDARRDRGHRHHRGRRLGAVRVPVPRVRGPGAAAAPPRPRPPLAAVAAAAAQRPAARGRGRSTRPSRSSSRRSASACRTSTTSRRCSA